MGDVKMIVKSMSTSQHLATILALIVLRDDMLTLNVLLDITGLAHIQTIQTLPFSSTKTLHFSLDLSVIYKIILTSI